MLRSARVDDDESFPPGGCTSKAHPITIHNQKVVLARRDVYDMTTEGGGNLFPLQYISAYY